MTARSRRWWAVALCACACIIFGWAHSAGMLGRHVVLDKPYLDHCARSGDGFRCTGNPETLKVVNSPIRMKARRDYRIVLRGRSLTTEPALVYVDFFAAGYDSPVQKGQVMLFPGSAREYVLRWPSEMPPENALLRIANREAVDYEITSVDVSVTSKWLPRLRDLSFLLGLVLLVRVLWFEPRAQIAARLGAFFPAARASFLQPLLLALIVAIVLLIRVSTMNAPMVFGDEMSYALLSSSFGDTSVFWRNHVLKPLPNQLFFDIYHLATLCGEATLTCARAMNCLFFAMTAFPLFALSRKVLPGNIALLATAVVLLLPNNAYTSFFMPESLYFFCFYCVAFGFVSFIAPGGRAVYAVISGIALAVLSLVKPHGLTILLACSLTLLYGLFAWRGERRRLATSGALMLLSFVAARGLLGSLGAPAVEGSLFERTFGLYASLLSNTMQFAADAGAIRRFGEAAFNNVGSLAPLFGVPLVASVVWLLRPRPANVPPSEQLLDRLHVFVWILLVCLVYGTIKFTAYIAGADASQDPARIHERYYDFIFGLLLIAATASLRAIPWQSRRVRVASFAVVLMVGALAAWYATTGFVALRATWTDHPILYALRSVQFNDIAWLPFVLLLGLVLMPLRPMLAGSVYASGFLLIGAFGFSAIWREQAGSQTLWDADQSALALKAFYRPDQLTSGLVVGEDLGYLYRTSFYARSNFHVWSLRQHSVVDVAQLAPGAHWILAYGDYEVLGNWRRIDLPGPAILYQAGDDAAR